MEEAEENVAASSFEPLDNPFVIAYKCTMLAVETLAQHRFPPGIIEGLKADGVNTLLEHQVEAVKRFDLLGEQDLLVSLPTSCGKTLIGELAGVGAALSGKRAIFSVPLKAIAREKFETFKRRYEAYGLRIKLATGEFTEHLEDIDKGRFDIAVFIHEKLLHTIVREPAFLRSVGVAVVDELQGIEEPSRGPKLEFLLALLKQSTPRTRRVGLAGTLAGDDPLVAHFGGRVLTAHRRPVDLRDGIVLTDRELAKTALAEYGLEPPDLDDSGLVCVYRTHNTGLVETETLPLSRVGEGESWELLNLALGLAEAGESTLAFFPSRREAEWAAHRLAEAGSLSDFRDPIEAGFEVEDEGLLLCLEQGVGYHHADCSPRERQTVEEAFRGGRIKLLCCTSTLAMGVNLPAHNVVIHPFVWNRNGASGELSLVAESVLRNMSGRAGRLGLEEGFGRALLLASSRREWDLYRGKYWAGLAARLEPRLGSTVLGPYVLAAVAAGHDTNAKLESFFSATLSYLRHPEEREPFLQRVREERSTAEGVELLHTVLPLSDRETRWELSPLGRVVATRGVSFATAKTFSDWTLRAPGGHPTALLCLLRICDTEEAGEWNWPRDGKPETRALWVDRVRERLGWEELASFGETLAGREAVSPRLEDAAKMAWGLLEWVSGEPVAAIQDNLFGVSSGALHSAGEGAKWLLETLADVWRVKGLSQESADRIRTLSCSAGSGLPDWALAWRIIPSELLDRDEKLRLAKELADPFCLLTRSEDEIPDFPSAHSLVQVREFLRKVQSKARHTKERSNRETSKKVKGTILLDVDLVENGGSYRARADRHPIDLGMRSAELLLRLVRGRRMNGREGWVHKKDLGVDPESLSQRMSDLRRRLGHPPAGINNWIESDRNGHYRLICEGERIRWNPENTPPEIRSLME